MNSETETASSRTSPVEGLLVEMKRRPAIRKRRIKKIKKQIMYKPQFIQENHQSTVSVKTQTQGNLNWNHFLSARNLDRYSMGAMLGVTMTNLSKVIKYFRMLGVVDDKLFKMSDQIILTIWKYRFNLNFDSYFYMFTGNEKNSENLVILPDVFRIGTINLYKYVKPQETQVIQQVDGLMRRRLYLDIFEIPVVSNLTFDKMNYSHLRGTTTFKAIVLFDGTSKFIYISDLYGGSTKISHIIRNSEIRNIVRISDYIIHSKRIKYSEALLANANIEKDVSDDKKVIFTKVERQLRKKFKILNDILPLDLWPISNKIFRNCVTLFNMQY